LLVVFLAVAVVMAMIGEGVARAFVQFRPLDAYRLDILGSIAGIAAFSALSFTAAKPLVWGLAVALVLLLLYGRRIGILQAVAVACLVIMLGAASLSAADIWSPYYRISVTSEGQGRYTIDANGVPHQSIQRIGDRAAIYFAPYKQEPSNPLRNVLVIGAGNGNDVALGTTRAPSRRGKRHSSSRCSPSALPPLPCTVAATYGTGHRPWCLRQPTTIRSCTSRTARYPASTC
jgi:hypothetical protein